MLTPALLSSPLRSAITATTRTPEPELLPALLEQARLSAAEDSAAHELAMRVARGVRERTRDSGRAGLVQGLLQEFALSSSEGVALMCLAEALLRIPDAATRDALIRDKIGERRLALASRPQPVAVRQRRHLGAAAHRPAGLDAQRRRPRRGAPARSSVAAASR